jgi:hypothetical protein
MASEIYWEGVYSTDEEHPNPNENENENSGTQIRQIDDVEMKIYEDVGNKEEANEEILKEPRK